jgi:murein L,D-transpeptidase YafK
MKNPLLFFFLVSFSAFSQSFKKEQLAFERVRNAFDNKWIGLEKQIKEKGFDPEHFRIFIRVFKQDEKMEIWISQLNNERFSLFKTYKIAESSGILGPKRKEGDLQVPEGYYRIDVFNPLSDFYLSLGINYPNAADKIKGKKPLGGDIYIHGSNVTIGCVPLTDDFIKEVYALAVQAKNGGQKTIYTHFFPFDFNKTSLETFKANPNYSFWKSLLKGFSYFENNKKIPKIGIDKNGDYKMSQ